MFDQPRLWPQTGLILACPCPEVSIVIIRDCRPEGKILLIKAMEKHKLKAWCALWLVQLVHRVVQLRKPTKKNK